MRKLFQVAFRWELREKGRDDLTAIFNQLGDWLYINNNYWLVWHDGTTVSIFERLAPVMSNGDHVLIFEVNASSRFGLSTPWVWEWLDSKRSLYSNRALGISGQADSTPSPG